MKILCFGDSNTYGYDPRSFLGGRYPSGTCWVDILHTMPDWEVLNYGENGREIPHHTLAFQEVHTILQRTSPIDICTVMLGTNDLLLSSISAADQITQRMEVFLRDLLEQPAFAIHKADLLLIAPPAAARPQLADAFLTLRDVSHALAEQLHIQFADASSWHIQISADGVHFSEEGHKRFAQQILPVLQEILCKRTQK